MKRILFIREYLEFKSQAKKASSAFPFGKVYPCLDEKSAPSGTSSGHYFHQDLLVAQRIFANNPEKHVDVGSRLDGFIAHVASFRQIEVFDIRPQENEIPNILFKQVDVMNSNFDVKDYCDSVSSLHAIEHFGLGRYGDNLDYNGHLKGLENIYKMLKPGGSFYFSAPIGEQRIEFNAHRVFSIKYLLELFKGIYRVESFSYVNDKGALFTGAPLNSQAVENNYSCHYGCGIFEMTKLRF